MTRRRLRQGWIGVTVMSLGLALWAEEAAPGRNALPRAYADFGGRWKLDLDASRSPELDRIMDIQGASWWEKSLANKTEVYQTITQESNLVLRFEVRSTVKNQTDTLYLDGRTKITTNLHGEAIESHTVWTSDGQALKTTAQIRTAAKKPATLLLIRTLSPDRSAIYVTTELIVETNAPIKAVRIFRREN